MSSNTDTIAAIATPQGRGGLGIVRLSGPQAASVASRLTCRNSPPVPRQASLARFYDESSAVIDEGIILFFAAPGSYTGEDVVEIHTHGSRMVLQQIMDRVIELGCRLAEPGEFTWRAFHNDKIDLVQAEAVADLIDSVSVAAARSAVRSMEGEFSRCVDELQRNLVKSRCLVESLLDFPEEEIDLPDRTALETGLQHCLELLENILARARQGALLNDGIHMAIIGEPNVGKSTLLNRLSGREAAIVTDEPGTTRDLVEQTVSIEGIPVHIIDTAGLRKTQNRVELEGIRRAIDAAARADIILLVQEYDQPFHDRSLELYGDAQIDGALVVINNKIDLAGRKPALTRDSDNRSEISLSAMTGEGMDLLIAELKTLLGLNNFDEDVFIARKRHLVALEETRQCIGEALQGYRKHRAMELLAEDLRRAQEALNSLTGKFVADDLLGEIFSTFCIGK